jgi:hypothetical protein
LRRVEKFLTVQQAAFLEQATARLP